MVAGALVVVWRRHHFVKLLLAAFVCAFNHAAHAVAPALQIYWPNLHFAANPVNWPVAFVYAVHRSKVQMGGGSANKVVLALHCGHRMSVANRAFDHVHAFNGHARRWRKLVLNLCGPKPTGRRRIWRAAGVQAPVDKVLHGRAGRRSNCSAVQGGTCQPNRSLCKRPGHQAQCNVP